MLPREFIWEGWLPSRQWKDTVWKVTCAGINVKHVRKQHPCAVLGSAISSELMMMMMMMMMMMIEYRKVCSLFPVCFEWIRTRMSSKHHIITQKPLQCYMNGMGSVSEVKTLGAVACPNGKSFHWWGLCCQTKCKIWQWHLPTGIYK